MSADTKTIPQPHDDVDRRLAELESIARLEHHHAQFSLTKRFLRIMRVKWYFLSHPRDDVEEPSKEEYVYFKKDDRLFKVDADKFKLPKIELPNIPVPDLSRMGPIAIMIGMITITLYISQHILRTITATVNIPSSSPFHDMPMQTTNILWAMLPIMIILPIVAAFLGLFVRLMGAGGRD